MSTTVATPGGSPPFQSQIESVAKQLPAGVQEDFRVLMRGLVQNAQRVAPGGTLLTPGGTKTGSSAPPTGVGFSVAGANGAFTAKITNPGNVNGPNIWHEISYSPLKSFTSGVTVMSPTTGTSVVVNNPGSSFFFRIRSSFDLVNWSGYTLAATTAISAGKVSSAATSDAGAFNQTNYAVVSSKAVGSTTEVSVQGASGALSSPVTQKGPTQTTLPGATIYGVTPGSNQFVAHNGVSYVLRPTLAGVLADDSNTPIGAVSVVGTGVPTLPTIVPVVVSGAVVGYNVTHGGNGASGPYDLTVNGKGIGATTGTQTIENGVLISVSPGNPGGGYANDGTTTVTASGGVAGGSDGGGTAIGNNGGRLTEDPGLASSGSSSGGGGGPVTPPSGPANEVYATPNGAAGPASLRALVLADLPAIAPSGPAGGDLTGTYPNPTVDQVNAAPLPASAAYVGTNAAKQIVAAATPTSGITQLTGDVTAGPGSGSQAATLNRVVVGWDVGSGAVATDVGNLVAALRAANITQCVLTVTASDASTGLTFDIQQNGTSIFSAAQNVAAGSARGTQFTFALRAGSLAVAFKDKFGLNISSGTSSWKFSLWVQ